MWWFLNVFTVSYSLCWFQLFSIRAPKLNIIVAEALKPTGFKLMFDSRKECYDCTFWWTNGLIDDWNFLLYFFFPVSKNNVINTSGELWYSPIRSPCNHSPHCHKQHLSWTITLTYSKKITLCYLFIFYFLDVIHTLDWLVVHKNSPSAQTVTKFLLWSMSFSTRLASFMNTPDMTEMTMWPFT